MSDQKNKPKITAFKQQKLWAIKPSSTPYSAAAIFFTLSILFIAFGFPLYILSDNIQEISIRYDNCTASTCQLSINIPKTIPGPVFLYYELTNFYQNYRTYVRSKSYAQLRNGQPVQTELDFCSPAKYNKDFAGYYDSAKQLKGADLARPCGLIAKTVFNDTFNIAGYLLNTDEIVFSNEKDMWVDVNPQTQWRIIDNHLIVWMKVMPFSDFRKLWGVVESDISQGTLNLEIQNNYPAEKWKLTKSVVLSNASVFGGKNHVLGIVFIIVGFFFVLVSLVFTLTGILMNEPNDINQRKSWRFE